MNATARKSLRPYQARLIADVCRADGPVLVEQPTGSGKTMQIVTLVAMQLGRRFTHAVIAAPQQQIEHAFVHPDYRLVAFPTCQGVAAPDIEIPEGLILGARTSKQLNSASRLIAYLRHRGPQDYALACTHAALNRLKPERVPDDLSGIALFLDEAHHASADGLSEIVSLWRERGGQLYFFTATPYRGDGRPVALDGMRLYRRSLAEHMAEGFAPRHLESEIVALGHRGDRITAAQFTGEEAPPASYFDELMSAVCRRWTDDGRPKAIVRVPPMRGGSGGLVARLIHALASQGARVLDATGTGAEDKRRFLDALEAEKVRSHAESRYDVIVGIQRVMEGTDWPVCAAVYCVGMPGSLNTVVQLLGRAMRPKAEDYPQQHKDRAQLVFFVPCGGGSALADLSIDHSRHALLTCCFLADHKVGQEWIVLRQIHRGIEDALGPREQNPATADAENEANEPLTPEVRSEVELALASAREQIISEGRQPTLGEVVQQAMQSRSDLPEAAFRQVATEILSAQPEEGAKVGEAIRQEIARRLRIHPEVKKAMEEAFAIVLEKFRDATLKDSVVLESVGRQIHGVTGGQMRQFAQRLREAAPRPLGEDQILAWADAHHVRTGQWPQRDSGEIWDSPGDTWSRINTALIEGSRGLRGGSSLAQLLKHARGVRNIADLPDLTEEIILGWADKHYERTGRWPKVTAGSVTEAPDESWMNVNAALVVGLRGLSGGSSLAKLLAVRRGVRNVSALSVLTPEQILEWADRHYERTGEWPKSESKVPILEAPGETWKGIQMALVKGRRGLPGGSTLARLLAEHRGVKNHYDLPPFSIEEILTWADRHRERTGKWPNEYTGVVADAPDETWGRINTALSEGIRGLPGGSSLARLLALHRGKKNHLNLPALTEEQILAWADEHYARTGKWPTVASGPVENQPGEKWANVHNALAKGLRGLPGGSSLARLLTEHRGKRNHLDLPELTIDEILVWVDAFHANTGTWPKVNSGAIAEAPAETWNGIEHALRNGNRGLPGGSSLAQLLMSHRMVRNRANLPTLTKEIILAWADEHYERTGKWPTVASGPIEGRPGETWANIHNALAKGLRGLPGGSSLARLLREDRKDNPTCGQI